VIGSVASPKSSAAPRESEVTTPLIGVDSFTTPPSARKRCLTFSIRIFGEIPKFKTSAVSHSYPIPFSEYPPEVGAFIVVED
jgi:hypothetical protein